MVIHPLPRIVVAILISFALGRVVLGAEDLPTPPTASAKSVQYKRANAKFYAHGDVLKADPGAVILPPTAFAQNGDTFTYTPEKRAPKVVYAEVPNDWIEPITPPDMSPLNIAPDAMQIREPHGDVEVAQPNAPMNFAAAVDGEPLPNGAVIKTGADSTAAILFGGVDSARLMPNSEAAVQQAVASTSRAAEVDLTTGGVFSKVGTQVGVQSDYQVHTPFGVSLAQGGDFVTYITSGRVDVWVAQGVVELLQADGKKVGSIAGDGTGPLKLIRYPAVGADAMAADADSLTDVLNFIPMANQKLAALHQKAAASVPLTANEQAYLQRIKQVPALIKLEIVAQPPTQLTVLADGTVGFQGNPLSLVELTSKLKDFVASAYDPSVVVMAGTGATYANFEAAMKACKDAGVPHVTTEGPLPTAPPPPPAPPKPINATVLASGMIKLNGAMVSLDDFTAKLKAALATTPDLPVTIKADPQASYVALSGVVNACSSAAAKNLTVVYPSTKELTVAAHADGSIQFHGVKLTVDEFTPEIKAAVALQPNLPIVIHSNPTMDYAKFKAVADACNASGAKQVTVVQPAPQPPPPPSLKALVQADGTVKFQDAALKPDDFAAKFKDALAATPDAPVTLKADPKANYTDVSAAIDAIKAAGPKNFTPTLPVAKELSVTVHGDSSILFHGATVSADDFANEIKAAVALYPDAPIIIHSNPKADYTKFQAVVDACKAATTKEVTVVKPSPAMPPTAETPPAPAPVPAPQPAAPAEPLKVIAHLDGTIKFQGKTMQIDEFTAKIKDAVAAHPDVAVIIHSNPKLDYAKFEAVVDACKNAPAKEVDVVPPSPQPPATPEAPAPMATPQLAVQPPPAPAKPVEPATALVHDDGTVGFLGKRGTLDEFKTKLAAMVAATPTRELIIKTAGKKVSYDYVKTVLDACAAANVAHVTAPPPPAEPAAETPATNAATPTPPVAETPPAPVNDKPVPAEIDLAADGTLQLDGSTLTEDDLKLKLADIKGTNPKNPLVLMKAPGVTKDQWKHYVDLCHSMGLRLLVKNAKASAIAPMVTAPTALRPSAAEGGPALETPPAPEPETSTPSTNAPPISASEEAVPVEIELTPDGQVSFLGEAVSDSELKSRLAGVAQSNSKEPVLIVKDEKVSHEQLQHVVDICHAENLKVKIKTVKSSDSGALKPHAQLPVALEPPSATGPGGERILPIEIGLASKGRLTFDGTPVSLDELKSRLATVAKGNPDQPIVIMKEADVADDSADALVTVCQGVSAQLKISVKTAPAFTPSLPDNSPADNLPAPDVHLHAAMDAPHSSTSSR